MKIRRPLVLAAATAAVLAGTAAPAGAVTTTFHSASGVAHNCTFPGIAAQTLSAVEQFDGPGSIPHGTAPGITNISGSLGMTTTLKNLLHAAGYDGVRGSGMIPVKLTGATVTSSTPGVIAPTIWSGTTAAITFTGGAETFSAVSGASSATFAMNPPFSLALEMHKYTTGTWTPWTMNCSLKVTSPAQNTAFSPSLIIT
ncbi:hypothetical protein OHS58_46735 [Amycolatopsis sp. NBC_00348]|uniref:DUF6801 domain-containing protein n=1 Tax=Amycolatopsis sp. NBC_00348 TaxID=2975956 RepID=UPI002E25B206